jgi:hypothetical protein
VERELATRREERRRLQSALDADAPDTPAE